MANVGQSLLSFLDEVPPNYWADRFYKLHSDFDFLDFEIECATDYVQTCTKVNQMQNKTGKWTLGDSRDLILQDLDSSFIVRSINGKMAIFDRENEIQNDLDEMPNLSYGSGSYKIKNYLICCKQLNGDRLIEFWKIANDGQIILISTNQIEVERNDIDQVTIDESTVSVVDDRCIVFIPQLWRLPFDPDGDIPFGDFYTLFVIEPLGVIKQPHFNCTLSWNRTPYSQCLVGPYLFIETSIQQSAYCRVQTEILELVGDSWEKIIMTSEQKSFFNTGRPRRFQPQMMRDKKKIIYLKAHEIMKNAQSQFSSKFLIYIFITSCKDKTSVMEYSGDTLIRAVSCFIIDLNAEDTFATKIFDYDFDDDFRMCYLNNYNFVVHQGSWYGGGEGYISIWTLHDILKSEEYKDLKEDPDFSFQVTGDDCDNAYAIVSDTGIMTRNVLTGKIDNFFDFLTAGACKCCNE